jgi:hypothetical protein
VDKESYLKIGRPANACVRCGATIAETGKHPSILVATEPADEDADEPIRRDFCPACWDEIRDQDYFSFWLARREKPSPNKARSRKERNSTLLSYFDYLYQQDNSEYAQHLFFISHLLMKFSVFRWVRSEPPEAPGGNERIIFRNTVTDDFVTIESVTLDEERIAAIKKEIDEYLTRSAAE